MMLNAVATLLEQPLLHFIGDGRRRADEGETAEAAGDLGKLAYVEIVAPGEGDEALAPALAAFDSGISGSGPSRSKSESSQPTRNRQRREAAVRMNEAIEKRLLLLSFIESLGPTAADVSR